MNQVFVLALPGWQLLCQYLKMQLCIELSVYIDILKIIPYLQANPYRLKNQEY